MPQIGEQISGKKIGRDGSHTYIWSNCPLCNDERWVRIDYEKRTGHIPLCKKCYGVSNRGENNYNWKGGYRTSQDYVAVRVYADDFFSTMANRSGYVLEHRLVVAKALGRCLLPWEIVHHKGTRYPMGSKGDKQDNRYPENLELLPTSKGHIVDTIVKGHIKRQDKRIKLLEWQVNHLNKQLRDLL